MSSPRIHVGRLLLEASRSFDDDLTAELRARGYGEITPAHSAVFAHLDREGTRASELARRAGVTRQSMGELVADLEAKGYVERRADPADGRAKIVVLTSAGRRLDREATTLIAELERTYARTLGRATFDVLVAALARIADRRR